MNSLDDGNYEYFTITRRYQHEQWNRDLMINDIGILELTRDVTFNGT